MADVPPHPCPEIEATLEAWRAAEAAVLAADAAVLAVVLAEVRRQMPGVPLGPVPGARGRARWRDAIDIVTCYGLTPRGHRWVWDAVFSCDGEDQYGTGDTVREALEALARCGQDAADAVAALLAEVSP